MNMIGKKMVNAEAFAKAKTYVVSDLWTGETSENNSGNFEVSGLEAYGNVTLRISISK